MQTDKASAASEPKYLKDLNTMKTLSEQLVLLISKYEVAQKICFGDHMKGS